MDGKAGQLSKALLAIIAIALLAFLSQTILEFVHGLNQAIFAGNSIGKLAVTFSWYSLNILISICVLKTGILQRLAGKEKLFLKLFLACLGIAYFLGVLQFYLFAVHYQTLGPFAALSNGQYLQWEASIVSHNHFPKASIYFFEKITGLHAGPSVDDGRPFYEIYPDIDLWASAYLLLGLFGLVFAVLHLNARIREIKLFDYFIALTSFIGLLIGTFDGGIGSTTTVIALVFFLLYWARNYLRSTDSMILILFPLIGISLVSFVGILLGLSFNDSLFSVPLIVAINLAYYFAVMRRKKILQKNAFTKGLAVLFGISLLLSGIIILDLSFGRLVMEYPAWMTMKETEKGGAVYFYGLPAEMTKAEFDSEVEKFGGILESHKEGWVGYARITPNRLFRSGELEDRIRADFRPKQYFYVEEGLPYKTVRKLTVYWFENADAEKFLPDKEFLDVRIIGMKKGEAENSTDIVIEGKTDWRWQMLSVLNEIRQNGFKGKLMVAEK